MSFTYLKLKTLLLLICLNLINISYNMDASLFEEEQPEECLEWFPEPVSFKINAETRQLDKMFHFVLDLLSDRDEKLEKRVEEFVVDTLNGKPTGFYDVNEIVFSYMPSIRQLFIAHLCLILAAIIFLAAWKVSLFNEFAKFGELLHLYHYRMALTLVPIFCTLGLFILHSHLSANIELASSGIQSLETSKDENFMPIKTRIQKKMAQYPCIFKRDYLTRMKRTEKTKLYLNWTVNGTYLDMRLQTKFILNTSDHVTTHCRVLDDTVEKIRDKLKKEIKFDELRNRKIILTKEYTNITVPLLKKSVGVYAKALGKIEEFVTEYYQNVVYLPSKHLIQCIYIFALIMLYATFITLICFSVLLFIEYQLKTEWAKWLAHLPVAFSMFFSAFCFIFSIIIITRVAFSLTVQQEALKTGFALLGKANVRNFSENGQHYKLNYSSILLKSAADNQTMLTLLADYHNPSNPIAIDPEFLFVPTARFNKTIEEMAEIVLAYPSYAQSACEKARVAVDQIRNAIKVIHCDDKNMAENFFKIVKETEVLACNISERLKKSPPEPKWIHKTAYSMWKTLIIPGEKDGLIMRTSVIDATNPMQVYFVFENPSKKLQPTILEPMFGMAVCLLITAPIYFVLSIHFMMVLPFTISSEKQNSQMG